MYAVSQVTGKDLIKKPGLHRSLFGDGLACCMSGFIRGPPVTSYSEVTGAILQVGNISMTGIGLSALIGVFLNLILPQTKKKNENSEIGD